MRRTLANALEGSLGNKWAKQVLNDVQTAYVRDGAGVARDFPLSQLANPLDYLTLGQLLDLAMARDEARRAGLTPTLLGTPSSCPYQEPSWSHATSAGRGSAHYSVRAARDEAAPF